MRRKIRQYVGLLAAVGVYYAVHEGAHLVYALMRGVFKGIHFMGLGMQIDIYAEKLTAEEMGMFCILGSAATLIVAYALVFLTERIVSVSSKVFGACAYYVTLALLVLDPLYLSVLYGFFGGGDMNGIANLIPEVAARSIYGAILLINLVLFWKILLPKYKRMFEKR